MVYLDSEGSTPTVFSLSWGKSVFFLRAFNWMTGWMKSTPIMVVYLFYSFTDLNVKMPSKELQLILKIPSNKLPKVSNQISGYHDLAQLKRKINLHRRQFNQQGRDWNDHKEMTTSTRAVRGQELILPYSLWWKTDFAISLVSVQCCTNVSHVSKSNYSQMGWIRA